MTSVTRVEITGDLQIARIFVSVMGTDAQVRTTMAGLKNARGRIQRAVAQNLQTRVCPELRIELDESFKKAAEIIQIINESVRDLDPKVEGDEEIVDETPDLPDGATA